MGVMDDDEHVRADARAMMKIPKTHYLASDVSIPLKFAPWRLLILMNCRDLFIHYLIYSIRLIAIESSKKIVSGLLSVSYRQR